MVKKEMSNLLQQVQTLTDGLHIPKSEKVNTVMEKSMVNMTAKVKMSTNKCSLINANTTRQYSGSDFHDFLKEEGIYEEVTALAQEELKDLQDGEPFKSNDTTELPNNLRSHIGRFFRRIRHVMNL